MRMGAGECAKAPKGQISPKTFVHDCSLFYFPPFNDICTL